MPAATSIDPRALDGGGPAGSSSGATPGWSGPAAGAGGRDEGGAGSTGGAMRSTGIAASSRLMAWCSPVIHGASGWLATPGDSAARPNMSAGTGISPVSSSGR